MMTSALASRLLQDGLDMHRRGAVAEAAARYSQILTFEPKNIDALCLLGVAKMELKGFAEAVDLLRKAVKLAPKHAPAHNFLGAALKETGRIDADLASFNRAISHQPDFMDAYVNRADLLMSRTDGVQPSKPTIARLRCGQRFFRAGATAASRSRGWAASRKPSPVMTARSRYAPTSP